MTHRTRRLPAIAVAALAALTPMTHAATNDLEIGGARISVILAPGLKQNPSDVMEWVRTAATAVATYDRRYPVSRVQIFVAPRDGDPVNSGREFDGERIVIHLDPSATAADLHDDWMLTHEMFHLGFPRVDDDYHYLEEGLSDYLEPLARARIGNISDQEAWKGYVEGMPNGLPKPGDGGLDGTSDWGRTYWGGCIFWLMVDLDIRQRSNNSKSLDDSIRALVNAGGNGGTDWELDRVIRVGDAATGAGSIRRIHDLLGPKPVDPHLDQIWRDLGIHLDHGRVTFDDTAPLAAIRRSMTARSK